MTTEIYVQDVTLRDGMHALRHRITPERVGVIVRALDRAGVAAIEVSHGDGLGGSSLNYGPGSHSDWAWIEAAVANAERAVMTTLLLPGVVGWVGRRVPWGGRGGLGTRWWWRCR